MGKTTHRSLGGVLVFPSSTLLVPCTSTELGQGPGPCLNRFPLQSSSSVFSCGRQNGAVAASSLWPRKRDSEHLPQTCLSCHILKNKTQWHVETSCMQTDMSQLQHVEEQDSMASGDTPCIQTYMSQLQLVEEDSLVNGDRPCRPTCTSCNMMRKTHRSMETALADRHVLASTMLRKTHWPMETPL